MRTNVSNYTRTIPNKITISQKDKPYFEGDKNIETKTNLEDGVSANDQKILKYDILHDPGSYLLDF